MSTSFAEKTRQLKEWRASIARQKAASLPKATSVGGVDAILPPPVVEGILPDLSPERPGDQQNLLDRDKASGDLKCTVVFNDAFIGNSTVSATWNGVAGLIADKTFPRGTPAADKFLTIPHSLLSNQRHTLVWRLLQSGNEDQADPYTITVDLTPPNSGSSLRAITFTPEVQAGVTDALLTRDGKITGTVPLWSDIARGDRILFNWTRVSLLGTQEDYTIVLSEQTIDDPSLPITVDVPEADVRRGGEGTWVLWYQVFDRAGNDAVNLPNFRTELQVVLMPLPVFSGNLELEKSTAGNTITRQDIYNGVALRVPEHAPWVATDTADVYWKDDTVPVLTGIPVQTGRFYIPITWQIIAAAGDGTGLEVKVKVNRRNSQIGTFTNTLLVNVDLAVPGPTPDPNEPGPVNDNLALALIKSESHGGTGDDNKILPADTGKPATAEVTLIAGFSLDESLQLFWPGVTTPVDTQPVTDIAAGEKITFTVPWAAIEAGQFGAAIPVYYRVVKTAALTGEYQQSRDTPVDSQVGGISDLDDLTVPDHQLVDMEQIPNYEAYIIGCVDKPWDGIKVFVPPCVGKVQVGATMELTFVGFDGWEGNMQETDRETLPPYPLTQTDIDRGFEYVIPYSELVEETNQAKAQIFYRLIDTNGKFGESARTNLVIYRVDGNGNECTATP